MRLASLFMLLVSLFMLLVSFSIDSHPVVYPYPSTKYERIFSFVGNSIGLSAVGVLKFTECLRSAGVLSTADVFVSTECLSSADVFFESIVFFFASVDSSRKYMTSNVLDLLVSLLSVLCISRASILLHGDIAYPI